MSKNGRTARHVSTTPATNALKQAGARFSEHLYDYVDHGGTSEAARQLGENEHHIVKTLVVRDSDGQERLVLMHGDRSVSMKALARALGVRSVRTVDPVQAHRVTGYHVGGISPFGTRRRLPVHAPGSVLSLDRIPINGGQRGYLVGIDPALLTTMLATEQADCACAPDPQRVDSFQETASLPGDPP